VCTVRGKDWTEAVRRYRVRFVYSAGKGLD